MTIHGHEVAFVGVRDGLQVLRIVTKNRPPLIPYKGKISPYGESSSPAATLLAPVGAK